MNSISKIAAVADIGTVTSSSPEAVNEKLEQIRAFEATYDRHIGEPKPGDVVRRHKLPT